MKKNLVHGAFSLFMLIVFTTSVYPQWIQTNWPASNSYFNLYAGQDRVFARTWDTLNGGRMFLTVDNGANWTQSSSAETDIDILSIVMLNSDLLAGTWNGFYRSTDGGTSWNAVTPSGIPADSAIWSIAMINTTLFAGTRGAVYKSSDNGAAWTEVKTGIPMNARITSLVASGDAIFAGSDSNGVFITTNDGANWTAINSGLTDKHISQLTVMGSRLFAVTLKGIFISDNNGTSWTANSSSIRNINCFVVANNQLFAGTDSSGIYLSNDNGVNWTQVTLLCSGMPADIRVWSMAAGSSDIFAGTSAGVWRMPINPGDPVYHTISADASEGGTISPEGAITVYESCSQVFAIAPASGYRIDDVVVDGIPAGAVASYTFTNVTRNHSISAAFAIAPFTITASAGSGGSISPSGTVTVSAGSSRTFTITPSTGYLIANVLVDGVSAGAVSTYTFSSVSANHTISASFSLPTRYQINCGSSSAASPFIADQYGSGGTQTSVTAAIDRAGVTNPAPQAVYQSERYGTSTYTFPNLAASEQYTVRLHFAELYWTATGSRKFNVLINGTTVLSNFDIYAETGARYKATVREFTATANGSGQIVINFNTVTDNATIEGIEIIQTVTNAAPTIATAASAIPSPVTASTTSLSVLGDDDNGESNLTYTWATTGTPPAAVTFSANGTNGAKATTATFTKAGSYNFQVTVRDAGNLTVTSSVTVTVDQTLTGIVVSPASATVNLSATQQFGATARDQFANDLATQPTFTWNVSGGGTIDANGLFTAGTTAGGPYTVTAQSGSVSGTAGVTVTIVNNAPTIATAASASPSPVTASTTSLSVLGADDNGESNLTYTWAATGTPPAAVAFSANGTNGAKNATATFTKAGSYGFQVTVRDAGNLTVTSSVTVTVNQTLTGIVLSPTSATVATSATQQFTATARDQFATNMSTQPSFTWSVSGVGTISGNGLYSAGTAAGSATVTAASGGKSGTAIVSVTAIPATVYRINCGGSASSPYTADQYSSGGTAYSVTSTISTTGVTNPAPQAVYQTERYGTTTYTLPGLTAGAPYTVRLHFAELYHTATGKRVFNVLINGTTVLSNYDIYAATGARYKAVVREFTATANASGQIVINFNTVTDNAKIGGIEIIETVTNAAPTIATAASAGPNPTTASTTSLSVLGADDNGESNLTYTWATTGTPPAAVAFSANGTNGAKATTATFTKAGSYNFQVTVRDAGNLTVTSSVAVTVNQTITSIVLSPSSATVATSATQQFTATARDQFATNMSTQPSFTWSVSGVGTIGNSGLYSAGTAAGSATVTAASGGVSGTAGVTVNALPATVYQINTGSNSAASPFSTDQYGSGGTMRTVTNSIDRTGVTNPAPQAVYQSERYGASTYTLPNLTSGTQYTVRLHFAELYQTATGKRRFNVAINGSTVLSNFDIYAVTGARYKAVVREFTATANGSGQIVVNFTTITDKATIEGIEIIRQ